MPSDSKSASIYRDVRCYVERVEFPLVTMQGSAGRGTMHTLVAQLVAASDPMFAERTFVEFELLESFEESNPGDGKSWFVGEIMGYTYVSTSDGNYVIINCSVVSSYQLYSRVAVRGSDVGSLLAGFADSGMVKDVQAYTDALLGPRRENPAPGILGGLLHLYYLALQGNVTEATFFNMANKRLLLDRSVTAYPGDATTEMFLTMKGTRKFISEGLKSLKYNLAPPFATVKQELLRRVFYDSVYPCGYHVSPPAPVTYRSYRSTEPVNSWKKYLEALALQMLEFSVTTESSEPKYLSFFQDVNHMLEVAACEPARYLSMVDGKVRAEFSGALVPDSWSRVTARFFQAKTTLEGELLATTPNSSGTEQFGPSGKPAEESSGTVQMVSWEMADISDVVVFSAPISGKSAGDATYAILASWGVENLAESTNAARLAIYRLRCTALRKFALALADILLDTGKALVELVSRKHVGKAPEKLNVEVLLPELYFAVPPECNIIIPSMYSGVTLSKNLMQEPTRLIMVAPSKATKGPFYQKRDMSFIVAPNIDILGVVKGQEGKRILEDSIFGKSVLLPHERYSGPIPLIVPLQEAAGFELESYAEMVDVCKKLRRKSPLDFISSLANYRYWEQRLKSRTASVQLHHFSHLIPGLPVGLSLRLPLLGTDMYYTGSLDVLSYAMDQDRFMSAEASLSHVVGVEDRKALLLHRRLYSSPPAPADLDDIRELLVAAELPGVSSCEKAAKLSSAVNKTLVVSEKVKGTDPKKSSELASYAYQLDVQAKAQFGPLGMSSQVPSELDAVLGPPTEPLDKLTNDARTQLFDALGNPPDMGKKLTSSTSLNMEYDGLVTPPWLDSCYDPENIEKVYRYLFGVGSMYPKPGKGDFSSVGGLVASRLRELEDAPVLSIQRSISSSYKVAFFLQHAAGTEYAATLDQRDPRNRVALVTAQLGLLRNDVNKAVLAAQDDKGDTFVPPEALAWKKKA